MVNEYAHGKLEQLNIEKTGTTDCILVNNKTAGFKCRRLSLYKHELEWTATFKKHKTSVYYIGILYLRCLQ